MASIDPIKVSERFEKNKNQYQKLLDQKLSQTIGLQEIATQEAYQKHNCLDCAACCKNYSPRFKGPDIKRISKYLGVKETEFLDRYLHRDEDGDYVLNKKPCPFLQSDNRCEIYEVRPSDCQRFPYSDEDVFIKRKSLTMKNASFCLIAQEVLDRLRENIQRK
jgi:uncharacterized protein